MAVVLSAPPRPFFSGGRCPGAGGAGRRCLSCHDSAT